MAVKMHIYLLKLPLCLQTSIQLFIQQNCEGYNVFDLSVSSSVLFIWRGETPLKPLDEILKKLCRYLGDIV